MPLVPCDGARVVRESGAGRDDQRRVRAGQGRPRRASRRRRRLHDGHPGDDRAGRLADDGVPHARRPARSTPVPTTRPSRVAGMPGFGQLLEALGGAWQDQRDEVLESACTITAAIAATADAISGDECRCGNGRRCWTRRRPRCWRTSTQPRRLRRRAEVPAGDGLPVPASPPPADRRPGCAGRGGGDAGRDGRRRPARPARPAVSPATRSTPAGSSHTSRRCCTTTRCCCAATPSTPGSPARPRRCASVSRRSTSCSTDLRPPGGFAASLDADTDGVEGLDLRLDPGRSSSRCSARRRRAGSRSCAR